jgi:hypothetical protein
MGNGQMSQDSSNEFALKKVRQMTVSNFDFWDYHGAKSWSCRP